MTEALARLADDVGELLRFASFPRAEADLVTAVEDLSVQISRMEAARALLTAQLEAAGWAKREGATSTSVWLRNRCNMSHGAAHRTLLLGKHLTASDALSAAMAEGRVTTDQALVIGEVMADLPRDLGIELRRRAEQMLLEMAPTLAPADLHKAGERIVELIAPQVAEEAEARRLARLDEEAHRKRQFRITVDHAGRSRLSGRLDAEATAVLRVAIDALARPRPAADGTRDPRSAAQRNADALHDLCRLALDAERLPEHGGTQPHLIITTSYDALVHDLSAGTLDSGVRLSPATIRRLACDAQIIPAVLGSSSELLDLGRTQRIINAQIRTALIARDGGCTFPGCDRPARWCQGHHVRPWAAGGETSLDNSTLLCGFHHRLIHQGDWKISRRNDGHFAYIPPPHIDPQQRPRVNNLNLRR